MLPRSRIAAAVAVFFLSYAIFLVIWIQVKPHYGNLLAHIAAPMAAWTTGTRLEKIEQGAELADITFSYYVKEGGPGRDVMLGVQVPVSNYSFNVPLTLALIAGLYAIFRWRLQALAEACLILVLIHLGYIYFLCILRVFYQLAMGNIVVPAKWVQFLVQFMWGFTDNLIIRFEPFLIAVYLWLRQLVGDRSPTTQKAAPDGPLENDSKNLFRR